MHLAGVVLFIHSAFWALLFNKSFITFKKKERKKSKAQTKRQIGVYETSTLNRIKSPKGKDGVEGYRTQLLRNLSQTKGYKLRPNENSSN